MLPLTVNTDYLSVDTAEWLDDMSEANESLSASFARFARESGESWVSDDLVTRWLKSEFGRDAKISGIYGESGIVSVTTCNFDTFLDDDISYVFAHVESADNERSATVIVETGHGYYATGAYYVSEDDSVRDFNGDDDADAFGYSSGFAAHDTRADCVDWIFDDTFRLWPNGGSVRDNPRIDECISPDADGNPRLVCPLCGDTLSPYVN